MAQLFQYAIIKQQKLDANGDIQDEAKVLVPITEVLASDDRTAALIAGRAIPEEEVANIDRITVVVRPF